MSVFITERVRMSMRIVGMIIFMRMSHHFPIKKSDVLFACVLNRETGTTHPRKRHSNKPMITRPNSAMK